MYVSLSEYPSAFQSPWPLNKPTHEPALIAFSSLLTRGRAVPLRDGAGLAAFPLRPLAHGLETLQMAILLLGGGRGTAAVWHAKQGWAAVHRVVSHRVLFVARYTS